MKERVAPFISPSFIVQMTRSIALIGFPEKLKNGIETFFPLSCALSHFPFYHVMCGLKLKGGKKAFSGQINHPKIWKKSFEFSFPRRKKRGHDIKISERITEGP